MNKDTELLWVTEKQSTEWYPPVPVPRQQRGRESTVSAMSVGQLYSQDGDRCSENAKFITSCALFTTVILVILIIIFAVNPQA